LEGFDPDTPLSWAIRDMAGLTGTKFGCGRAFCGAYTVHVDGKPVRSCSFPASAAAGREVTTIEGVSGPVARAVLVGWAWSPGRKPGCPRPGRSRNSVELIKSWAACGAICPD
jgi:isoquinoline 1-oxidoreductase subunit alpha